MTFSRDELKGMIPDYLNNALGEQLRLEFEEGLSRYPDVERELQEFAKIKASYAFVAEEVPQPSEALFQQVMKGIEGEERPSAVVTQAGLFARMRDFFQPLLVSSRFSWSVAGVQMAIILILVATIPQSRKYTTLSSEQPGLAPGHNIHIVFDANAKEMEIRGLLAGIGGRIVDGPSSQGLYTIRIDEKGDLALTLEKLKKHRAVRFVEKGFDNSPQ